MDGTLTSHRPLPSGPVRGTGRRWSRIWPAATLLAGLALPALVAVPVPELDLAALCRVSDLIVVGRVTGLQGAGSSKLEYAGRLVDATLIAARLQVSRVLEGSTDGPSLVVTFLKPKEFLGYESPEEGQFGVFFLKRARNGYEPVSPYYPSVVAEPGAPRASGAAVDQVASQLQYVLRFPGSPMRSRLEAVYALRSLPTPAATSALAVAARSGALSVRVAAMAALLAQNDVSILGPAARLMLRPREHHASPGEVSALASAVQFGIRDPKAVPALSSLLRSQNPGVRRGAAAALRNTHDPKAVQPLAESLYDPDREVRYYAVVGLGEITGQNKWTPSVANFQQNEQKFLKHWRDWAQANGYLTPRAAAPPNRADHR